MRAPVDYGVGGDGVAPADARGTAPSSTVHDPYRVLGETRSGRRRHAHDNVHHTLG